MHDLTLSVAHHLLFASIIMKLAVQKSLLNMPLPPVRRLGLLDAGYGISAVLLLIVGVGRVIGPGKGWAFYEANPFFWAKIACFALIGVISIYPTVVYQKWRMQLKCDADFYPSEAQRRMVSRTVLIELVLFVPLLACAALMARWPF